MRIGCTPFLNARPLVWGLEKDHEVIPLPPSRMAKALLAGQLDVALVPTVEMFRERRLRMLDAPAIGCKGAVRSVRLLVRGTIGAKAVLLADSNSSTSVLLTRLLLKRIFGVRHLHIRRVDTQRTAPGRLRKGEILLQIGDVALRPAPKGFLVHDLGLLWGVMTGLPFVFAPWMIRRGSAPRGASALLKKAVREGMKDPKRVAKTFAPTGCDVATCTSYLKENLSFHVGPAERRAIRLFEKLLRQEGLL